MSLRDFENFLFFLEILYFFVPHYTRQVLQKIDAKRNDHVFPKLNEPSWFLQIFILENNIFHIFYFLFPNWYRVDLSKYHLFYDIKFCLSLGLRCMNFSQDGASINTLLISKPIFESSVLALHNLHFFKTLLIWKTSTKCCLCDTSDYD